MTTVIHSPLKIGDTVKVHYNGYHDETVLDIVNYYKYKGISHHINRIRYIYYVRVILTNWDKPMSCEISIDDNMHDCMTVRVMHYSEHTYIYKNSKNFYKSVISYYNKDLLTYKKFLK